MRPKTPVTRYRPVKTSTGKGTFTITLAQPITVWVVIRVHEAQVLMLVDSSEDILLEDVVAVSELQGAAY